MSGSTGAVSASCGGAPEATSIEPSSGVGTALRDWPLISGLEFAALPTAVGCARDHTREVLREWSLGHLIADAELLVSELVTNALQASWTLDAPAPLALRLLSDGRRLIIEAWDRCIKDYDVRPREPDGEHGRGLLVVEALSQRWGVRRPSYSFKVVWAELEVTGTSSTEV